MKKNLLATVLLSGLVLGASATTVSAAETPEGGSVETSKVEVKLQEEQGNEPGSGPFKDKLAIVHKPNIFKFSGKTTTGSLNLSNENAQSDTQFISVNDDRKDEESGEFTFGAWELTGALSELTDGGTPLLANMIFTPGELLQYDIGELKTVNGVEDYGPAQVDPNAAQANKDKYKLSGFTLAADGDAVPFLTSAAPTGTPTQTDVRGVATNLGDVNLTVATGNATKAGTYTGTVTWTLSPK